MTQHTQCVTQPTERRRSGRSLITPPPLRSTTVCDSLAMRAAQSPDTVALAERLWQEHAEALSSAIVSRYRDSLLACLIEPDEAVAILHAQLLRKINQFDVVKHGSFGAWWHTVAWNRLCSELRRHRRHHQDRVPATAGGDGDREVDLIEGCAGRHDLPHEPSLHALAPWLWPEAQAALVAHAAAGDAARREAVWYLLVEVLEVANGRLAQQELARREQADEPLPNGKLDFAITRGRNRVDGRVRQRWQDKVAEAAPGAARHGRHHGIRGRPQRIEQPLATKHDLKGVGDEGAEGAAGAGGGAAGSVRGGGQSPSGRATAGGPGERLGGRPLGRGAGGAGRVGHAALAVSGPAGGGGAARRLRRRRTAVCATTPAIKATG